MERTRDAVVNIAAVSVLAFGAAVALAATAAADPPPPPPVPLPAEPVAAPLPPPPPPGPPVPVIGQPLGPAGFGVLGQTGQAPVPGALGAPNVAGLDATTVLGQNAAPAPPGAFPGLPPNLNPFNNAYGPQQNLVPSAPGQGQQFDVAPGQENADVSRREWLGRYIDMYRADMLKGGLLGQMPQEQLGEPLPGTAPPPGTSVPPGLVQFLPEQPPADVPPPAPGAPLLPPPPG